MSADAKLDFGDAVLKPSKSTELSKHERQESLISSLYVRLGGKNNSPKPKELIRKTASVEFLKKDDDGESIVSSLDTFSKDNEFANLLSEVDVKRSVLVSVKFRETIIKCPIYVTSLVSEALPDLLGSFNILAADMDNYLLGKVDPNLPSLYIWMRNNDYLLKYEIQRGDELLLSFKDDLLNVFVDTCQGRLEFQYNSQMKVKELNELIIDKIESKEHNFGLYFSKYGLWLDEDYFLNAYAVSGQVFTPKTDTSVLLTFKSVNCSHSFGKFWSKNCNQSPADTKWI
jgi:hypothetical protein